MNIKIQFKIEGIIIKEMPCQDSLRDVCIINNAVLKMY